MANKLMFPNKPNLYTLIRADNQPIRQSDVIERIGALKLALVSNSLKLKPFFVITQVEIASLLINTGMVISQRGLETNPKRPQNFLVGVLIHAFYDYDDRGSSTYILKGIARIV